MSSQITILGNVVDKLDQLPIQFAITDNDVLPSLKDAMREMDIKSLDNIEADSQVELYLELRTEWYALSRLRNSSSTNFRYSTGVDGKSVDKSMIPEMISNIMDELDTQFSRWFTSYKSKSSSSGSKVWNMTPRTNTRLTGD